ncbi:MAG TPA: cell division protein FtsQ/DivIB [Candidatus Cybelea sp.]|nr:cell division protein FtsQ/DivIB [Candidatus Cybelea sp.]
MKLTAGVAAVLAIVLPVYWAISSGAVVAAVAQGHQALLDYTARSGFALREVRVDGRGETAVADILNAVHANRGDPMLGIDIDAIRNRLEDLPWIVSASVERRFPDQLVVSVTEAEPMALWQRDHKLYLVSRGGEVIETANIAKYSKLLIIVGDDAPKKAEPLFEMLAAEPDLRPHVTAAVLVGKRRWNIRLDNDVDVKLPEDAAADAWHRFADLNRKNDLLNKDISAVDMRQPDRVVVRQAHPTPAADPTQPPPKSNET